MTGFAVPRTAVARPSGWWGMALFLATEATLFGTLLGTYVYLRLEAHRWPPRGVEAPSAWWPLALTALLAATIVPLRTAVDAARAGRAGRAVAAILVALVAQAGYLAAALVLLARDVDRVPPDASAFGSIYAVLLGAHAAHVAAGMLLELWLVLRLARGVTRYRRVAVEVNALYWLVVAVLAVLVVAVQVWAAP